MSPRFARAAVTSAALSVLFLVVYGACNQLAALRADVGTIAFAWERHIPFVPAMIVPYMSIDLFFVAAPFVCASDDERRRLAARIVMAVLVAGLCFLLFPLRFAFERPAASGMLGAVFDWFRAMDLPYNLAPSLHIALRTILAAHYGRHTRGWVRGMMHAWFSLIGLSTLLVWQHHLADVVTGFILGGCCIFVFPDGPLAREVRPNRRVGAWYAAGALVAFACAWALKPWGALLLWPAFALALMAAAYFRLGASIFRKTNGRLPSATRVLLAPVLLGQWLSLHHYRRRCAPWSEITPHLWIGRRLDQREAAAAVRRGVTAVLDLTGEFSAPAAFRAITYRNLPVLDLTAPTPRQLDEAVAFIARESRRGIVYVHCKIGYSRSAAAVAAYLLRTGAVDGIDAAIARLRAARPTIVIRAEIVPALRCRAA